MKEDFISFKTLKLAKTKGIDFFRGDFTPIMNMSMSIHKNVYHCYVTQALLQRYLREEKDILVDVQSHYSSLNFVHYSVRVKNNKGAENKIYYAKDLRGWATYESALENGLQKALQSININN